MAKRDDGQGGDRFQGTLADRLARLWRAEDPRFDELLDEVLDGGRQAVIEAALGKLREGEHMPFMDDVETLAEIVERTGEDGERLSTSLYWFVAEVDGDAHTPPPAAQIEEAFSSVDLLKPGERVRLLPVWLDPEQLSYLEATDRRALLRRMLASFDAAVRFAADQEVTAETDEGPRLLALVGLFDEVVEDGAEDEDWDDEESSEEVERIGAAVDTFSAGVARADSRIVRCRPVGGLTDLLEFVAEEPWDEAADLEDLERFIDVALAEVSDGLLDAEVRWTPGALEVGLSGSDGRWVDSATFEVPETQLPAAIDTLKRLCRSVRPANGPSGTA
ncbi:hypothetical protein [Azospirillum sp. TSO22-1]|uniref:hypothetical protein n=1 Tax=Azospirillum sp. TSO22-1 TaxID=716789 RepID=UPI000D6053BC|nr:hypothetical protein [Azospirillum sp. TSO22-1]PWC54796.1 hypothetical protein TSO221_07140 [Azospirillum sp. TSO22-1]